MNDLLIVEYNSEVALPERNLFTNQRWMDVFRSEYGFPIYSVTSETEGRRRGILFFCLIEDIYGKRLISLPFSDYTDYQVPAETLCRAAVFVRDSYPGIPFTLKLLGEHHALLESGFKVIRKGFCHRVDLKAPLDELWGNTSHAFRKAVKKAERNGIRFAVDNSNQGVDRFYRLLLRLRREKLHILPQPKSFYLALFSNFILTGKGDLCVALKGDIPVASAFILKSGNALYDKMGVSDLDQLDLRPNNLLLWEVMKRGHDQGEEFLDMGLTQADNEGMLRFKESLGAYAIPVTYYRYVPTTHDESTEQQIKAMLTRLSRFVVDTATNDAQIEGAAEILYRYFC